MGTSVVVGCPPSGWGVPAPTLFRPVPRPRVPLPVLPVCLSRRSATLPVLPPCRGRRARRGVGSHGTVLGDQGQWRRWVLACWPTCPRSSAGAGMRWADSCHYDAQRGLSVLLPYHDPALLNPYRDAAVAGGYLQDRPERRDRGQRGVPYGASDGEWRRHDHSFGVVVRRRLNEISDPG